MFLQMADLIPVAVRIALRNAVGGWGPYELRGIDDLFLSHGFKQKGNASSQAGQRRTLAEAYNAGIDFSSTDQAKRYLSLVEEVLERFPPDGQVEEGVKLRRELARAGIAPDAAGHLHLPFIEAAFARDLETRGRDFWIPDRIRVFLSHTSAHREAVGEIARILDRFAYSCFVAHDQIEPTREWQDAIELALRTCDVMVAYITADFSQSHWTDQEVGWALGRELVIVPVRVEAVPYGFFGSYQAVPVREGQTSRDITVAISRAIASAIFHAQRPAAARLVDRMTDSVVTAFCQSPSFDSTRQRFELLQAIPDGAWKERHLVELEKAARENGEIREGVISVPKPRPAPEAVAQLISRVRAHR
jgi:hypothetical protein